MKTTELELDREVVSAKEWEAARQQLLVKEKELTRARDVLAAQRRRMPWMAVEKEYKFDGKQGKASLRDLFDGRRQKRKGLTHVSAMHRKHRCSGDDIERGSSSHCSQNISQQKTTQRKTQ